MPIIKKLIILICFGCFCMSFSQEAENQLNTTVFINLNDKSVANFCINKSMTKAQFNFYLKGYKTKYEREEGIRKSKNGLATSLGIPTFIFSLYSSTVFSPKGIKPEKLKTLKGLNYITLKEFQNNSYQSTNSVYIIHKLNDGTYLKWKTYYLLEE
ncbi:hypothetical protein [Flavobacterium sandaracinum]|uniref:Uncharacterized protein n=1 Tax=Flavobacterium sandaracinum TaxID=2541733 RepID=A0A4R5CRA6_9FLAO|nr:hypothetical protein [Flavobacterium sandaracinum]TDE01361.1 hypothetical protein E0F91_14635 [Flavobacterium sandaracinum]